MSLLTPEQVPVSVYRWDDVGSPVLDKTAGCVARIIKNCLVTGYGDKPSAGWTLTHENTSNHNMVFGFNNGANPPVFLRVYGDNGKKANVQLVKNVVSADSATMVVECDTAFTYLGAQTTGEWMLIASDRAVWFFAQVLANSKTPTRSGAYLFAGIVTGAESIGFLIKHTGGAYGETDDDRLGITDVPAGYGAGMSLAAIYNITNKQAGKGSFVYMFDGIKTIGDTIFSAISPLAIFGAGDYFQTPIYSPSRNDLNNFAVVPTSNNRMVNFCTSMQWQDTGNNTYLATDYWEY